MSTLSLVVGGVAFLTIVWLGWKWWKRHRFVRVLPEDRQNFVRETAPSLLHLLPQRIEELQAKTSNKPNRLAKLALERAQSRYQEAKKQYEQCPDETLIEWVALYVILTDALSYCDEAHHELTRNDQTVETFVSSRGSHSSLETHTMFSVEEDAVDDNGTSADGDADHGFDGDDSHGGGGGSDNS